MNISESIISLTALIIATASTTISYMIYRNQREPEVIVFPVLDKKRPSIVNLVVKNIGNSVALNIRFTSDRVIPKKAFGISVDSASKPDEMDAGPIVNGIPSLGPSAERVITWGQHGGLINGLGNGVLNITATYQSNPPLRLFQRSHKTVSILDAKSFEGTDISDHNWDKRISENLGKISKSLDSIIDMHAAVLKIELVHKKRDEERNT